MEKYNFKDNSDLKNNTAENLFDDSDIQACSATDCTGLIPALPQDEAEVEAYEDIYPYITKHRKRRNHKIIFLYNCIFKADLFVYPFLHIIMNGNFQIFCFHILAFFT